MDDARNKEEVLNDRADTRENAPTTLLHVSLPLLMDRFEEKDDLGAATVRNDIFLGHAIKTLLGDLHNPTYGEDEKDGSDQTTADTQYAARGSFWPHQV